MGEARSRRARWTRRVAALRIDGHALYLASRDPRVPLLPKLVAAAAVAYALSPIDLVPDFIPVVGYLDDLLLVPLLLGLAVHLMPPDILEEHRARAAALDSTSRPRSWAGAAIVIGLWIVAAAWLVSLLST